MLAACLAFAFTLALPNHRPLTHCYRAGAVPLLQASTLWARFSLAAPTTRSRRCCCRRRRRRRGRPPGTNLAAFRFPQVPPGYAPFSIGQRVGAVVRNGESRPRSAQLAYSRASRGGSAHERRSKPRQAERRPGAPPCWSSLRSAHRLRPPPPPPRPAAGTKLFGVGFCASLLGVGITNGLMGVRQMLDPSFVPLNPPQVGAGALQSRGQCLPAAARRGSHALRAPCLLRMLHLLCCAVQCSARKKLDRPPSPPALCPLRMCW